MSWRWLHGDAEVVITGRDGGVSHGPFASANIGAHVGDHLDKVQENRRRTAALARLTPAQVAGVAQVHGSDVWVDLAASGDNLADDVRWDGPEAGRISADGLVTTRPGVGIAVGVADCAPIGIVWGDAIAAIHAGWRGLDAGVIEATVRMLRRAAGSAVARSDIAPRAVLGPCLGACCFEVGPEVAERFDEQFVHRNDSTGRPHLDVRALVVARLAQTGIETDVIDVCTRCDPRCFSHRGDGGTTGRQCLLIARVGTPAVVR